MHAPCPWPVHYCQDGCREFCHMHPGILKQPSHPPAVTSSCLLLELLTDEVIRSSSWLSQKEGRRREECSLWYSRKKNSRPGGIPLWHLLRVYVCIRPFGSQFALMTLIPPCLRFAVLWSVHDIRSLKTCLHFLPPNWLHLVHLGVLAPCPFSPVSVSEWLPRRVGSRFSRLAINLTPSHLTRTNSRTRQKSCLYLCGSISGSNMKLNVTNSHGEYGPECATDVLDRVLVAKSKDGVLWLSFLHPEPQRTLPP